MKPNTTHAMQLVIDQARHELPFNKPLDYWCDGPCRGCAKKLLDVADQELEHWQTELDCGSTPTLGDVQHLAKLCTRVRDGVMKFEANKTR